MPDPAPQPDPESPEAQMKLLEQIVGDLPAFKPGEDTGQGILAPEGEEAKTFYQSFQPPQQAAPTPQSGQPVSPQSQTPAPAQAQPPAPAPVSQPGGRLFAGKYRSVEEMERGYQEAEKELRRRNEENMVLKAAQLATESITGGFRREREAPTPPPAFVPVQFQGEQPVVPVNDLRQEMLAAARVAAQETTTAILTPLQRFGSANASIRSEYPEFAQQEGAFTQWLRDNPRYQEVIQRDPEIGLESAYLKFARQSGTVQAQQATQATLAAQHQVEQARNHAAPAGNIAPSSRRPTEQESKWSELERLYKEGIETGNMKPFQKARVAFALGDQFMNTLDRTNWGR